MATTSLRLHLEVANLVHAYKMAASGTTAMTDSVTKLETEQDVTKIISECYLFIFLNDAQSPKYYSHTK